MQKVIGELSIRAIIAKNVLLGKQSRLYSGFSRFHPVASSSSAVFPFNYRVVKALSSSAMTNGVQIVAMRKESSDSSASDDHDESFVDTKTESSDSSASDDHDESFVDTKTVVPFWEYVLKNPPRNVYADMDHTFHDLLRKGKVQLRFLISRLTVESLSSSGDEFLNCLKHHGASLEITDWKMPEGLCSYNGLSCGKMAECFKIILPKIGGDMARLLLNAAYTKTIVGPKGKIRKKMIKKKKMKRDRFTFYDINCPHSTDRVCQLRGFEETMIYFLKRILDILTLSTREQMEIPFNNKSHVGRLVEKYGGYEPECSEGSLDDGNVSIRFSIPRDLLTLLDSSYGNHCSQRIRKLTCAKFKQIHRNPNKALSYIMVVGLPIQLEQACYMLKQGLEMIEDGKDYLRGEWKDPEGDQDDDDEKNRETLIYANLSALSLGILLLCCSWVVVRVFLYYKIVWCEMSR